MGKKRDVEKPSPKEDVTVMPKIVFDNTSSASESAFTVQILALIVSVRLFQNIEGVSVVKGAMDYRYTVGSFDTKEEALETRQQAYVLGYKDAFVRKVIAPTVIPARFAIQIMAPKNPVEINFSESGQCKSFMATMALPLFMEHTTAEEAARIAKLKNLPQRYLSEGRIAQA